MTVHQIVFGALSAVLPNTRAVELKQSPTFPAILFDIATRPEELWCHEGGYDQHQVDVVILAREISQIMTLLPQVRSALEALEEFMVEDDSGDADYEDAPDCFGYFVSVRLRTRR